MNQVRTTEQRNPASMEIDRLSAIEIARLMNEQDQHVLRAMSEVLEPANHDAQTNSKHQPIIETLGMGNLL